MYAVPEINVAISQTGQRAPDTVIIMNEETIPFTRHSVLVANGKGNDTLCQRNCTCGDPHWVGESNVRPVSSCYGTESWTKDGGVVNTCITSIDSDSTVEWNMIPVEVIFGYNKQ